MPLLTTQSISLLTSSSNNNLSIDTDYIISYSVSTTTNISVSTTQNITLPISTSTSASSSTMKTFYLALSSIHSITLSIISLPSISLIPEIVTSKILYSFSNFKQKK
ncbi:hypothetical protein LY90DRAFT_512782 [Neocallimastix californiae]|uniref:Uncharacterized protein n=1 Tax=Neocallimastix californiae TaxID=1754190 RepID=A0A1Y2B6X2_9FUNG|nr:hypothetical protein LY90DRAFT_512782 [Neocallimastix californiae]|eukprot:ORY29855.1 hypothetical protein LY90DRAFT_512782 [Neocallimastix californiae]